MTHIRKKNLSKSFWGLVSTTKLIGLKNNKKKIKSLNMMLTLDQKIEQEPVSSVKSVKKESIEKVNDVKKQSEHKKEVEMIEKINKEFSDSSIESNQKEKLKKQQEIFQNNPASYNGAIRENYSWTQSIKDIDIQVKVKSENTQT